MLHLYLEFLLLGFSVWVVCFSVCVVGLFNLYLLFA